MISLPSLILLALCLGIYFAFRRLWLKPGDAARLERIRLVARLFKWVALLAFAFMVCVTLTAMINPGITTHHSDSIHHISISGPVVWEDFRPEVSGLYYLFWILFCAFFLRGIGFFYRLFSNLERGILFGPDNVQCVRLIGWWLVAAPILGLGYQVSKLIWAVSEPLRIDVSSVPNELLKGFFVIFVAWIMDEGRKIQEEQELTV